jgi:hypothetical protein
VRAREEKDMGKEEGKTRVKVSPVPPLPRAKKRARTHRIRILPHSLLHPLPQVLLVRRVLNDGDHKRVEVAQRGPGSTDSHAFDHFLVGDSELGTRPEEGGQDGVLRVSLRERVAVSGFLLKDR